MVKDLNEFIKIVKISPSTLNISLEEMPEKLKEIEKEIDYVHIDVMDGKFVSNLTDGAGMFKTAKLACNKPLDVHLMVSEPLEEIKKYEGAEIITFHMEAVKNQGEALKVIQEIKNLDSQVGISIKPGTEVEVLEDILDKIDMILIMTVEPGYGGQKLIQDTLNKVKQLREMGFHKLIEVDGGITIENAEIVRNAGVDIIVAGTAVFAAENKIEAIRKIKGIEK